MTRSAIGLLPQQPSVGTSPPGQDRAQLSLGTRFVVGAATAAAGNHARTSDPELYKGAVVAGVNADGLWGWTYDVNHYVSIDGLRRNHGGTSGQWGVIYMDTAYNGGGPPGSANQTFGNSVPQHELTLDNFLGAIESSANSDEMIIVGLEPTSPS